MFRINAAENRIEPLDSCTFAELGFRERQHLQEWVANLPSILGEELLILQKEFAGFSDTNERLDLLALDRKGSLVVIENKLDDTGRDVTWQALKYASYCAGLSKDNVREIYQQYLDTHGGGDASNALSEFLREDYSDVAINSGFSQRVILVAANFRKEVTSTVLWLANFGVRVQCFRLRPFRRGDELFLSAEQIIPVPETESFLIGLAQKGRDEAAASEPEQTRHSLRRRFWTQVFQALGELTPLYANVSPGIQSWTTAGSGLRGVGFNFAATRTECRVELYIDRGDVEENRRVFDRLLAQREQIQGRFGGPLKWLALEGKQACRVEHRMSANIYDEERWPEMVDFLSTGMARFEKALRPAIESASASLRAQPTTS